MVEIIVNAEDLPEAVYWSDCRGCGECSGVELDCSRVSGELADRVRACLDADENFDVLVFEKAFESGYSEFTITDSWSCFTIVCGKKWVHFDAKGNWSNDSFHFFEHGDAGDDGWHADYSGINSFACLLAWLDEFEDKAYEEGRLTGSALSQYIIRKALL